MTKRGRVKRGILWGGATLIVALTLFLVPTIWLKPWSIEHFYARVFLEYVLRRPMALSGLRLLEPLGLYFHNDELNDFSIEFDRREARRFDRELEILRRYDRGSMSEEEGLSYDILEWFMADAQRGNRFMFHDYPVNQLGGIQSGLPDFMLNVHQLGKRREAEDYVERVSKFGRAIDQVLEGLELREREGIVPPRFVIDHVLREMDGLISPPAAENVLYTHFAEKTAELEGLGTERRERLLERLEREIESGVYPAYRRLIAYFEELRAGASDEDGVWKLPAGDAYYAWTLRHHTTTDLSASEIHRLGLEELERLHAEARAILAEQGYPTDDVGATLRALHAEERFIYPDSAEGRERILADYQTIIDEIDERIDPLFNVRPSMGVRVERVPEFMQATAPGAYYQQPPLDGSKPGIFFVNLRDVREIPRFGMRTLAVHEAIPGHHFQLTITQELTGVPFFRRVIFFTAYGEGWALYAERLAAESGLVEDPFERLGYLVSEAFRATRLVVDTGIHAQRWSRERAIEFMLDSTGMPEGDVVAEVERYIVDPGQACAYKVGQLKILELRERARERLGAAFDLREFHDVVLTGGPMPLSILERRVESWLELAAGA